jgi:FixJ family two-component response regulator
MTARSWGTIDENFQRGRSITNRARAHDAWVESVRLRHRSVEIRHRVAPALSSRLIGLVDDDDSVLRAVTRLLHVSGLLVKTFRSGEELLAWPQLSTLHCLVLDVTLAGTLTGLDVHARLRTMVPSLPVIFITGRDEPAAAIAGARCLSKPFDDTALIAAIREALEGGTPTAPTTDRTPQN